MSNFNFYFSPTGGTKRVADAVAEGWGGDFIPVDLMGHPVQKWYMEEDSCLFAVPVYNGRVPAPAVEHIRELVGNGALAIAITVFGNRAVDDALVELYDELQKAGFRCMAAVEAVAQHSILPKFGTGRPDQSDREELRGFGAKIRQAAESGSLTGELELPGNRPYKKLKNVPIKPVAVNCCIACGRCGNECPTGAIHMNDMKRTDVVKCITCMHCVVICPAHVRSLNGFTVFAATNLMRKSCGGRKPNKLYL